MKWLPNKKEAQKIVGWGVRHGLIKAPQIKALKPATVAQPKHPVKRRMRRQFDNPTG